MPILNLTLENIRSYRFASIAFLPGVTAICGPNGVGKSTIMQAIGLGLFGSLQVTQSQFIRDGAQQGIIEVRFVSNLDGLTYHVIREINRKGASTATLYSPELNATMATGVRDVQREIARHLGLGLAIKPATLFDGIIGVPQGALTTDFLLPPAPRKTRFEDLLALKEFETAYQKLGPPMQHGRQCLTRAEGKLEILDAQLTVQDEVCEQVESLKKKKAYLGVRIIVARTSLAKFRAERERLDHLEQEFSQAREALQQAKHQAELTEQRTAEAEARMQEARKAAQAMDEARPGHELYCQADSSLQELEHVRSNRDELRQEIADAEVDLVGYQSRLSGLEEQIVAAKQAEKEASALAPDVSRQEHLNGFLESLQIQAARRQDLMHRAHSLGQQLSSLSTEQEQRQAALQDLPATEKTLEEAEAALEDVQTRMAQLDARIGAAESQLEDLGRSRDLLDRGQLANCPTCGRALAEIDRKACLEHLLAQFAEIQQSMEQAELEGRGHQVIERQLKLKLEAIRNELLRLLRTQSQLDATSLSVATLQTDLESCTSDLKETADVEAQMALIKQELMELRDPDIRQRAALMIASKLQELLAAHDQGKQSADTLQSSLQEKQGVLARYCDLDRQMIEMRQTMSQNRPAHETYQQCAPLATELAQRELEATDSRAKAQAAVEALTICQMKFDSLEHAYWPAEHTVVRDREQESRVALAEMQTSLQGLGAQLLQAEKRLAELEILRREKEALEAEIQRLTKAIDLLGFLRTALRDTGPELSRRLLIPISRTANEIFADLTGGDRSMELAWGEDYGITLRRGPYISEFTQLSGGEQMRAALAVRLALLRELSDVRIAFFDEPTLSLDSQRRQALAAQLGAIRGFEQLFVVSHHDTFEGAVDNAIHIINDDSGSHVVA